MDTRRSLQSRFQQRIAEPAENTHAIKLLVVLEANRRKKPDERSQWSDWAKRDIPQDDAQIMLDDSELDGFIHPDTACHSDIRPGMSRVNVYEVLYMTYLWQKHNEDLVVSYMSIELLLRIFQGGSKAVDQLSLTFDAFYGGVDLAVNIREAYAAEFESDEAVDLFLLKIKYMSKRIPVWPPIPELLRSRHKYEVVSHLDDIAANITKTPRPRTTLLRDTISRLSTQSEPGLFLKREASDCCNHICAPEKVSQLRNHQIEEMAAATPFRWMIQDFVPSMKRIGEWRVLIVGGHILYVLNTWINEEGRICAELRLGGYSLKEMGHRMNTMPGYISDDIMDRRGGTINQRRMADNELYDFCVKTLEALVKKEGIADSSLQLICRIDVALIQDVNGSVHYFVNEVERGIAICLFSSVDTDFLVERVVDELGPEFVKWIRRRKQYMSSMVKQCDQ